MATPWIRMGGATCFSYPAPPSRVNSLLKASWFRPVAGTFHGKLINPPLLKQEIKQAVAGIGDAT